MRREKNINKSMIISIVVASVLAITLIGALIGRTSRKAKENQFAGEMSSLNKQLSESESASTQIGKSVDESEEEENEFETAEMVENSNTLKDNKKENTVAKDGKNNSKKEDNSLKNQKSVASSINTENTKKDSESNEKNENNEVENNKQTAGDKSNEKTVETNAKPEETMKDNDKDTIEFEAPVKGEILREFAKDSLVFSNTLQEWMTHNGVDIKADKTTVVKSVANGTVSAIKNDPRYGLTVIVNHDNGYQTVYSNLLTAEFVVKGEKIEKGQSIGTVGNSASFEVADEYHLHFELLRNNEYLDPVIYMNFE